MYLILFHISEEMGMGGCLWMMLDDVPFVVILSYLIQCICINNKKNRNMTKDDIHSLNNLPQDQYAVFQSTSLSHTVPHISLHLTTPVEQANYDAKEPIQSRSSQLVPITICFVQDHQLILRHSPLWLQSFPLCLEGDFESRNVCD